MFDEQYTNLKLVQEIEKWPVLYNHKVSWYTRRDLSSKAWSDIGKKVGMTPNECKEKWKNLRAVFVRHMRPKPGQTRFGKPYYLTDAMQFAVPYIKVLNQDDKQRCATPEKEVLNSEVKQEPPVDIASSPEPIEECEDLVIPSPPPLHHTNQSALKDRSLDECSDDSISETCSNNSTSQFTDTRKEALRMFLLSMLPDLESMSDCQVRKFKQKCLQAVDEVLQSTTNPPSSASSSTNSQIPAAPPLKMYSYRSN